MNFLEIFLQISLIFAKGILSQNCIFRDCTCNFNADTSLNIYCSGFKASEFPERTLDNRTLEIKYLVVENFNLKSFPEDKLNNLSIETLRINMNNIEIMPKNSFRGLLSLKNLEIREYKLNSFGFGLFDTISLNLTRLDFSYSGLTIERFNKLFNSELFKLAKLNELNLSFNDLISFEEKWAVTYSRLKILNLGRNNIFEIKESIFDRLNQLKLIDLSYNHFSNLSLLSQALKKATNLDSLNLRGNSIQTLPTWPTLDSMIKLDLSENNVQHLSANSFHNFTNLTDLILKNNKITRIEQDAFASNSKLVLLQLSNNFLSSVPNILNLNNLKYLDLSNQNGNLISLGDNSFDRSKSNSYNLTVNLKSNAIQFFANKTFCSKYSNIQSIENLQITKQTFSSADKCIFSQLSQDIISREVTISIQQEQNADYSNVCGCNSKVFFNNYKIQLAEACDPCVLNCSCFFLDDCKTKPEYKCNLVETNTTLSETPKNSIVVLLNDLIKRKYGNKNILSLISSLNNRTIVSSIFSNSSSIDNSNSSIPIQESNLTTFTIKEPLNVINISKSEALIEESSTKITKIEDNISNSAIFPTIDLSDDLSTNLIEKQSNNSMSTKSAYENENESEFNEFSPYTNPTSNDLSFSSILTSETRTTIIYSINASLTTINELNISETLNFESNSVPVNVINLTEYSLSPFSTSDTSISTSTTMPTTKESTIIEKNIESTTISVTTPAPKLNTHKTLSTYLGSVNLQNEFNQHLIIRQTIPASSASSGTLPSTAKYRTLIDLNSNSTKSNIPIKNYLLLYLILIISQ